MTRLSGRWMWLLVSSVLAACATTQGGSWSESADDDDAGEVVSFEEACEEESSLLAVCAGERCGLYRCLEVMEQEGAGHVVLARGGALVLPSPQAGVQRYWGSAQELPQDSRPVFIIPWDRRPELLPSQQQALAEAAEERNKPHELHHIFPRAFREWFAAMGIDIDEFVIPLEIEKHRSIHRGERGGPWNVAWLGSSELTPREHRRRRSIGMRDSSSTSSSFSAPWCRIGNNGHSHGLRAIEEPWGSTCWMTCRTRVTRATTPTDTSGAYPECTVRCAR